MTDISEPEFLAAFRAHVTEAGGVRPFSRATGINQATVCQALNGRIAVPECIANRMGYVRLAVFRKIRT